MWMLHDRLAEHYSPISLITCGEPCIESVRLFPEDGMIERSDAYLYVGRLSDYFTFGEDRILLVSGYDMIILNSSDLIGVCNLCITIFDSLRDFDLRLHGRRWRTTLSGRSGCDPRGVSLPMFFGQSDLRIYAITEQYCDEDVYPGWNEVKRLRTMPLTLLTSTVGPDMEKYPEEIRNCGDPYLPGGEQKLQLPDPVETATVTGSFGGISTCIIRKKCVSPAVIQLARYCADIYGEILTGLWTGMKMNYEKYSFLVDILNGQQVPEDSIRNLYWQLGVDESGKLQLFKLMMETTIPTSVLRLFLQPAEQCRCQCDHLPL
jgi:hypothetical protein